MTFSLDAIDRQIVALLSEDGRISSAEMTRRIGHVSERAVRYRIERLVRAGVVKVTAIVNPQAVGYRVTGDVIIEVAPGMLQAVAEQLCSLDNISYVAGSVGDGDLSAQVYARDTEDLVRLTSEVIGVIPGVARVRTIIIPWKLKEVCDWRVPGKPAEEEAPET